MNHQLVHHWPPEVLTLFVDAIPRLFKGKQAVLDFFTGCGVDPKLFADIQDAVTYRRNEINKFDIVRKILTRLNDLGDQAIRPRREIAKRVAQWDDFSGCYDNQRVEAEGYVAKIQKLVNVKDSFTRIDLEREKLERESRARRDAELAARSNAKLEREQIKSDLFALFGPMDASRRGIALESVMNRLFKSHGILIREAFRRIGTDGEGVIEQIDGVISLDNEVYLVEMKWRSQPLGPGEVSQHLVRVFNRSAARGILISQSGYTPAGIATCRESLAKSVFVLVKLEEIVLLLERDGALDALLRHKVQAAIVDKNPLAEPGKALL